MMRSLLLILYSLFVKLGNDKSRFLMSGMTILYVRLSCYLGVALKRYELFW